MGAGILRWWRKDPLVAPDRVEWKRAPLSESQKRDLDDLMGGCDFASWSTYPDLSKLPIPRND